MKHRTQLQTPQTNMNGNTPSSLVDQLKDVLTSLNHVERAMSNATDIGHGRNFQTLADGENRARLAREAWRERMLTIHEIHDEVLEIARAIQQQERN